MIVAKPTWHADVQALFSRPWWLPADEREAIARHWQQAMNGYDIDLWDPQSIRPWSETIYHHLVTRNMPLTTDQRQFWPIDALETFRLWVNQGWRLDSHSPFDTAERIAAPEHTRQAARIRRDIRSLSSIELNLYRARLDDVMQVGDPDPGSPWQRYAYIHTNWCLHYQEAFALWHRAYLLYLEALLDHPIPYWDWMAADASVDGSPQAGLPEAFLEESYLHPQTGEIRPNPLRFAAAKDGRSKTGKPGEEGHFVQRNPLFLTRGDERREERVALFGMARLFQEQVRQALEFEIFSTPQGVPGYPWANIPTFDPPQRDDLYPQRKVSFDGLYEQPHDNYHGWIGGDMADNAYTAFDPVFCSYHANIDRILEQWIRAHPGAQFTTQVPLQPFIGGQAAEVSLSCPDAWRYTSLGDMAQDSRRMGYDYDVPVAPQYGVRQPHSCCASVASVASEPAWVVFDGIRCTHDSYVVDVFLNQPGAAADQVGPDNPHYVGRLSRIGMGIVDDKGRCVTQGVSRLLDARPALMALGLGRDDAPTVDLQVTHLDTGRRLSAEECAELPGFSAILVWGDPRQAITGSADTGGCCALSSTDSLGGQS